MSGPHARTPRPLLRVGACAMIACTFVFFGTCSKGPRKGPSSNAPKISISLDSPIDPTSLQWPQDNQSELWAPPDGAHVTLLHSGTSLLNVASGQVTIWRTDGRITSARVAVGPFNQAEADTWCQSSFALLTEHLGPKKGRDKGQIAPGVPKLPWYWTGTPSLRISSHESFDEDRHHLLFISLYWGKE